MKISTTDILVSKITESTIDEYLDLINTVKKQMPHPEWLGDLEKQDYITLLKSHAHIYVWRYQNQSIATGMLIPTSKEDLTITLKSQQSIADVIEFGPQAVHQSYRGNQLQKIMINYLEEKAIEYGYQYIIATVHPDNQYCINNLLTSGFKKISTIELERGLREVYRKKIQDN